MNLLLFSVRAVLMELLLFSFRAKFLEQLLFFDTAVLLFSDRAVFIKGYYCSLLGLY